MYRFLKLIFFLFFYNQVIFSDQEYLQKMLLVDSDIDIELLKSQYCAEGFLQGTLVETMKGYVPIQQIEAGDYLLGIEGHRLNKSKRKKGYYFFEIIIKSISIFTDFIHEFLEMNFCVKKQYICKK